MAKEKENPFEEKIQEMIANREYAAYSQFCEDTGHSPNSIPELTMMEAYESEMARDQRMISEAHMIESRCNIAPDQRLQSQGPLVLKCLNGGPNNGFLENHKFVLEMIKEPLGKMYPYLNFSETLAIVDGFGELKRTLPGNDLYTALNHINKDFFPELNGRKGSLSSSQKLRLKKLDVYGGKRGLQERVKAIPKNLQSEFRRSVVNPIAPNSIATDVPTFKKKGNGMVYAAIRAREMSKTINTFPREYLQGFL
jgi:hypothetical protein